MSRPRPQPPARKSAVATPRLSIAVRNVARIPSAVGTTHPMKPIVATPVSAYAASLSTGEIRARPGREERAPRERRDDENAAHISTAEAHRQAGRACSAPARRRAGRTRARSARAAAARSSARSVLRSKPPRGEVGFARAALADARHASLAELADAATPRRSASEAEPGPRVSVPSGACTRRSSSQKSRQRTNARGASGRLPPASGLRRSACGARPPRAPRESPGARWR